MVTKQSFCHNFKKASNQKTLFLKYATYLAKSFPSPTLALFTVPCNPGHGEQEHIMITNSDEDLASNSMDQHTYSLIASLVVVELDCVQFDYIH